MTAPPTMNCESCSDLLVELVCGELDADAEAAVRAHANSCERCGPELTKMARVMTVAEAMPQLEPSRAVEQRIMQAAREALARKGGSAQAIDSSRPQKGLKAWFARLGTWAMSPQVAMATVLLLMVGIGLYALPLGHDTAPGALRAAEDKVPEPAGAAAMAPAAELAPPAEPAYPADEARSLEERLDRALGGKSSRDHRYSGNSTNAMPERRKSAPARGGAKQAAQPKAMGDLELDDLAGAPAQKAATQRAAAKGALKQEAARDEGFAPPPPSAERASAAPAPAMQAPASGGAALGRQASAPGASLDGALQQGIAAAQRGDYAAAIGLLAPVANQATGSVRTSARLWLARSFRGTGDCATALSYYGPIVRSAGASVTVIAEAADCYERLGDTRQASELRARAASQQAPKASQPAKAAPNTSGE